MVWKIFFLWKENCRLNSVGTQPKFTSSKSTIETPEQCVKSVQS